jgi:hypothetical protein
MGFEPAFLSISSGFRGAVVRLASRQGLTLVHFSAQPEPFLVTEAKSSAQFSAQPETLWSMTAATTSSKKCSRHAGKWTGVAHK